MAINIDEIEDAAIIGAIVNALVKECCDRSLTVIEAMPLIIKASGIIAGKMYAGNAGEQEREYVSLCMSDFLDAMQSQLKGNTDYVLKQLAVIEGGKK